MEAIPDIRNYQNSLRAIVHEQSKMVLEMLPKDRRALFLNRLELCRESRDTNMFLGYQFLDAHGLGKKKFLVPIDIGLKRSISISGSSGSGTRSPLGNVPPSVCHFRR